MQRPSQFVFPAHILFFVFLCLALPVQAVSLSSFFSDDTTTTVESEFLPVEEAFQASGTLDENTIAIHFTIAPSIIYTAICSALRRLTLQPLN